MVATPTAKTTDPGPPAVREGKADGGRARTQRDPEDRLHVSALVLGLIDARASHVDFLDTPGGRELERWYRRHHPARRSAQH